MKIPSTKTIPISHRIPDLAPAGDGITETLPIMKKTLRMLKFLIVLCCSFAATGAFGQVTYLWVGASPGNLNNTNNWTTNGFTPVSLPVPNAAPADILEWNGSTVGPVFAISTTGLVGASGGDYGLDFNITAGQASRVTIFTTQPAAASSGLRTDDITIASGSGGLTLGTGGTTNALDMLMGGTGGQVHTWLNESANPALINLDVRWRYGGGGTHTLDFGGSGDWYMTNYFITANNSPTIITKSGAGTMYWTGGENAYTAKNSQLQSPLTINAGTLVLKSSDLLAVTIVGGRSITNGGALIYDGGGSGAFANVISGIGTFQLLSGAITLSGNNTFTGNVTLSGGTLIAGSGENLGTSGPLGVGSTISFAGGALGFSAANSYDYSPRFSTAAGQAYSFDTGGQLVTFTNALISSGGTLTKSGSGTLTLTGANTYSGATTVNGGRLVIEGASASGSITVANFGALGAKTGATVSPTTLTLGTSTALEFNNVTSTTTPIMTPGSITAGGAVTINVNSGTFVVGQSYPLFSWSSGSAPAVTLGTVVGAGGTLVTNGSRIELSVSSLAYTWSGLPTGNWNTSDMNWILNASPIAWVNGSIALFDDNAAGETNVTLAAAITTAGVTVNSSAKIYTITSSGANRIGGAGGLTKNGNSTLTLSGGVNNYSGATTINGGTVTVGVLANGGAASDIGAASSAAANLVLNGGRLTYTGAAQISDRLITLGTAGGTIESSGTGALELNNSGAVALSGSGARTLTLTGTSADDNKFGASLSELGGTTALTKSGSGKWIITGNNNITGNVTVNGALQVGAGGATGSLGLGNVANNGSIDFNRTGTVTNGAIVSGNGSVNVQGGGKVVLLGNSSYTGGTTVLFENTLQVGNGGPTGSLYIAGPMVVDGTIIFDTTGQFNYAGNGLISGGGNVVVRGNGGRIKAIGANSYTGWTFIDTGATFQPAEGNTGGLTSSEVTNNGTLKLVRQDTGVFIYGGNVVGSGRVLMGANNSQAGDVNLNGINTYSGGTIIGGGTIIFGDGASAGLGSFVGNVTFTNNFDTADDVVKGITLNRPDDFTISGNITSGFSGSQNNRGRVTQAGSGIVTLTGVNTYEGGTFVNAGTLQAGNGGTTGSIGTGPATVEGILAFNRSDAVTYNGVISGAGSIEKRGAGTLTLGTNSTYTGSTTVSNGTLVVNGGNNAAATYVYGGALGGSGGFAGPVTISAGATLAPGAPVGTLTITNDLYLNGNVAIDINKSLPQTNDFVSVSGVLTKSGAGTLTVSNLGPSLNNGDKFTLFSQPVVNGNLLVVSGGGPGIVWTNELAIDGSITVLSGGAAPPPTLNVSQSGSNLQFSWTGGGFKLQSQTNALNVGVNGSAWGDYPGGGTSPVNVPVDKSKGTVVFRLVSTP